VPVPAGQKGPAFKGWLGLRLREQDVARAFRGAGNIGLILGPPSGQLVDVDLDCPEARDLADRMLPPTASVTGRPSSPRSHRWYICPGVQTVRHRDPITDASIIELRGEGSQTLVGPSIHPTGEPYTPLLDADPAPADPTVLRDAVAHLAAEVVRLRHGTVPPPPRPASVSSLFPLTPSTDRTHLLRRGLPGQDPARDRGPGRPQGHVRRRHRLGPRLRPHRGRGPGAAGRAL